MIAVRLLARSGWAVVRGWRQFGFAALVLLALTAGKAAAASGDAVTEGPQILKMDPVRAPVFSAGVLTGEIIIGLSLAVENAHDFANVNQQLPRFEAAELNYLLRYANTLGDRPSILPLATILARFQKMWDQLVGPNVARVLVYTATHAHKG